MRLSDIERINDLGIPIRHLARQAQIPEGTLLSRLKRWRDGASTRELDADESTRLLAALRELRDEINVLLGELPPTSSTKRGTPSARARALILALARSLDITVADLRRYGNAPISQEQVSRLRSLHDDLMASDPHYRAAYEAILINVK